MTHNILAIETSILQNNSVSTALIRELSHVLSERIAGAEVTVRDLSDGTMPHFDSSTLVAIGEGKAELADSLIAEVQAADSIILAAPMYNFAVPSQLKAWFDHIARAGTTFKYTESGPVGLLQDKKVYVVTTRGGLHKDKPTDTLVPFLTTVLGFLGLTEVEFIFAEGLAMGDDMREKSLAQAKEQIKAIGLKAGA